MTGLAHYAPYAGAGVAPGIVPDCYTVLTVKSADTAPHVLADVGPVYQAGVYSGGDDPAGVAVVYGQGYFAKADDYVPVY